MAQIFVFGHVKENLLVKKSQKGSEYVCFHLREHTGNGRTQTYQVWAWGEDVSRLVRFGVKEGSLIWLTGTMQLVDCTDSHGKETVKVLKISLTNWGYLPSKTATAQPSNISNDTGIPKDLSLSSDEVLDGDRVSLPE